MEEILDAQNIVLKVVSSVTEDANKTRSSTSFDIRGCGPRVSKHARNHHVRGQKKIAFSYADPGGTLEKIKQPKTLI